MKIFLSPPPLLLPPLPPPPLRPLFLFFIENGIIFLPADNVWLMRTDYLNSVHHHLVRGWDRSWDSGSFLCFKGPCDPCDQPAVGPLACAVGPSGRTLSRLWQLHPVHLDRSYHSCPSIWSLTLLSIRPSHSYPVCLPYSTLAPHIPEGFLLPTGRITAQWMCSDLN